MKNLFLSLVACAAVFTAPALAQSPLDRCDCDPLVVMIEDNVRTDVICPGATTTDALLRNFGAMRPDGAKILVIRKTDGSTAWAPEGATPETLAADAGTVATFTGSAEQRVACFSAAVGGICVNPQRNAQGQIQPRDGLWRSTIGEMTITGCPQQMVATLAAAAPAALGAADEQRSFADPFHPDSLNLTPQANLVWETLNDGGWRTNFVPSAINAQQAPGASTDVTMTMDVTCDTVIEGETEIVIQLPEVARGLLGVGAEGCRIERPYSLQWISE